MARLTVKRVCPQCKGTGFSTDTNGYGGTVTVPCSWQGCGGSGYIELGYVEIEPSMSDLQDKHEDILNKLEDIKELIEGL